MEFLDKFLGKKYKTDYNGNLFTSEFRFGVLASVIISWVLQHSKSNPTVTQILLMW